jgi:hypothetical protein
MTAREFIAGFSAAGRLEEAPQQEHQERKTILVDEWNPSTRTWTKRMVSLTPGQVNLEDK